MKMILDTAMRLFLISGVAALSLGGVNAVTAPLIVQRKALELQQALQELAQGAQVGEAEEVEARPEVQTRYPVQKAGRPAGFILELAASGYGGNMKLLAYFEPDGTVRAVKLMDNLETPGLGKKAESPEYMRKFIGSGGPERPVPVRKNMLGSAEADAVTGATITFMGIGKALAEGARYVREAR